MRKATLHVKFKDGSGGEYTILAESVASDREFLYFIVFDSDVGPARLLWSQIKSILIFAISDVTVGSPVEGAIQHQGQQTP